MSRTASVLIVIEVDFETEVTRIGSNYKIDPDCTLDESMLAKSLGKATMDIISEAMDDDSDKGLADRAAEIASEEHKKLLNTERPSPIILQ